MNSAQKASFSLAPTWMPSSRHRLVDLRTDATPLRPGDAALGAQGAHQGIDLARGGAADAGLHDHGIQGLIDPASRLDARGSMLECRKLPERSLGISRMRSPTWVVRLRGR